MKIKYLKQTIALFLLLVILPAGSWYYLKSGFTFRKAALSELKDYGNFKNITVNRTTGESLQLDSTHVYLIKLSHDTLLNDFYKKLLVAYESRKDVLVMEIDCGEEIDSTKLSVKGVIALQADSTFCPMIGAASEMISKESGFKPDIILINNKGIAVQGYNLKESDQRARLIKHVSITMPGVKKVEKIIQKGEKEK